MKELNNDDIGHYEIIDFPKVRIPTLDFLNLGDNNHYVKGLVEFDVTEGRSKIHEHEKNTQKKISFTAWLLKCIGQAASEFKEVHSMMLGKNKIVKFEYITRISYVQYIPMCYNRRTKYSHINKLGCICKTEFLLAYE